MTKNVSDISNFIINLVYIGVPLVIMSGFVTAISPLSV